METRKVTPCGMLYSQGREYFLLKPYPIVGDSWERDNAYRWLAIPRVAANDPRYADVESTIYPHARHIVTTAFVVDYTETPEIEIRVMDEYDIADLPAPDNGDYEEPMVITHHWNEIVEVQ